MKVIQAAIPAAELICGRQKPVENTAYRLTGHCVEADCPGGKLLLHTLTGMLILLEKGESAAENREALIRHWFLVPEGFRETQVADEALKVARLLHRNQSAHKTERKSFTILTTTDCNARCFYCYEAGIRRYSMTEKTAEDTAAYILRRCGGQAVDLRWFGGEPLLNTAAIDIICRRLRERGVEYRSLMISNGYYLCGSALEQARALWNLQSVQITFDGAAETYNRIKAYIDAEEDPFSRVLRNAEAAISAGIEVYIRLNLSENNNEELARLAEELAERFRGKKKPVVYPAQVGDFSSNGTRFDQTEEAVRRYLNLTEKIRALGFSTVHKTLQREFQSNNCKADNDSCEIIMPNGGLCKCEHALEKECFGSIYSEERDQQVLNAWKEAVRLPECAGCALYPRCISLRKCAWVGEHCTPATQNKRIYAVREQMIDAYNTRKEEAQ